MISNRRREFTAGKSPLSITQTALVDDPDGAHYAAWAEGIKGNQNPGAWSRWSPRSYNLRHDGGGDHGFKWLVKPNDSDDFPSPRLWDQKPTSTSSPRPQPPSKSSLINNPPPPPPPPPPPHMRAQLIAMYRQEMIESMRDVPESAYELSLRDMVDMPERKEPAIGCESPSQEKSVEKDQVKFKGEEEEKEETAGRRGRARRMERSESMDGGGFLLRMFFPFSFGGGRGGRRKKSGGSREKTVAAADGAGAEWSSEKYKDRCSSSGSSSSTTSTSSTSSNNSTNTTSIVTSRRKLGSCYSFMLTPRGGPRVHE